MKRFKIAILTSLMIGALALAVGCDKAGILAAPQGLDYNIENELSWSPVEDARGYYVEIINVATQENKSKEVKRTSTKLSLSFLEQGDYEIRVKAVSKDKEAKNKWSETIHFQKGYETGCIYTLINNDTEYRLARFGSAPATIYIEDEYRGKPVTEIAPRAFKGYAVIEEVEVGDNVKVIGDNAFYGCRNLKKITLGDSVTKIGVSAFQSCNMLESIVFTDSLTTIENSAFNYCRALTSIELPNNLQSIGIYAFSSCSALEEIVLPDSLTSLGSAAFEENTSLKEVTIGSGLTELSAGAFAQCKSLELVHFSAQENLKKIGASAFLNCFSLDSISIPNGVETIASNAFKMNLLEGEDEEENVTLTVQSSLTEVYLPLTVTSIGTEAFYGTKFYMDAMFSDASEYIYADEWVIGATPKLKETIETLPYDTFREGTYGIADGALKGCQNLIKVFLPDCIRYLGAGSLQMNNKMRIFETTEDSLLENVGAYALAGCKILDEVILRGSKVKVLEEGAFSGCQRLNNTEENILTPKTLTKVGKDAFAGTKLSNEGVDSQGLIYAGNWLIGFDSNRSITSIEIRENTVGIADYGLANCESLATLKFADAGDFKYIGKGAFYRCLQLDQVDLSFTNVRRIEDYAFYACSALSKIDLPRLTSIGRAAFYNCMQLSQLDLSNAMVTEIGQNAFAGCVNLTKADLGSSLVNIGVGAFYACGLTEIALPGTVTNVSDYAFYACQSLKDIKLGSKIVRIGDYAFIGCASVKSISFSGDLKEIGDYAFYDCNALISVHFNEGLEKIGEYAFFGVGKLTELEMPSTLTSVGKYAFAYSTSLSSIVLDGDIQTLGEHVFYGCEDLTIYVGAESRPDGWDKDWNSSFYPVVWGCTLSEDGVVTSIVITENSLENVWFIEELAEPISRQHKFLGWATSADSEEVVYTMEQLAEAPQGTTLYAVWDKD